MNGFKKPTLLLLGVLLMGVVSTMAQGGGGGGEEEEGEEEGEGEGEEEGGEGRRRCPLNRIDDCGWKPSRGFCYKAVHSGKTYQEAAMACSGYSIDGCQAKLLPAYLVPEFWESIKDKPRLNSISYRVDATYRGGRAQWLDKDRYRAIFPGEPHSPNMNMPYRDRTAHKMSAYVKPTGYGPAQIYGDCPDDDDMAFVCISCDYSTFVCPSSCSACRAEPEPEPEPEPVCLRVRVVESINNYGVGGVDVTLLTADGTEVETKTTGPMGGARFCELPDEEGAYSVSFTSPFSGEVITGDVTAELGEVTSFTAVREVIGDVDIRLRNGINNAPLVGATVVAVRNPGLVEETAVTDGNGIATLPAAAQGDTFNISIAMDGFITLQGHTFDASADALLQAVFIVPEFEGTATARAVLSWGAAPSDLDFQVKAATIDNPGTMICISIWNGRQCINPDDGSVMVNLDVDIGGGYGPETMTFHTLTTAYFYMLYVYNYSGNDASTISMSSALISVFTGTTTDFVNVPVGPDEGRYWVAGCITVVDGMPAFTEVNVIMEDHPDPDACVAGGVDGDVASIIAYLDAHRGNGTENEVVNPPKTQPLPVVGGRKKLMKRNI